MIDRAAIEKATNDPAFGTEGWLTFYLLGNPDRHEAMAPALVALEAINLGGGEGGFVYAKVPVPLDEREIETRVKQVQALTDASGVEILVIDLDSAAAAERSKFYTLWRTPSE